ncbi:hypothetical protein FIBSPDRAFT_871818 [Athelia psychrophila]|uniref:BTB domain-containing protein n=1 Tax=Athelia psychrophila TaxID=1759441 RepID=A0A166A2F2_9AGAM|nr:hypothetical protein FIBSPDRAFT_871818 [Fibularhizoctonia sp. CBS 109695]
MFNHLLAPADTPKAQAGDYFGAKPLFYVPETAAVFNIVIHAIYRISCAHHHPAFAALPKYGVDLHASGVLAPTANTPPSPLFAQLLSHAPDQDRAFDLYALAAQNNLHALAVAASAHLRALPLHALTDDMAQRVGAVYLKKLFLMHMGRADALKGLLFPPPYLHAHEGKGRGAARRTGRA